MKKAFGTILNSICLILFILAAVLLVLNLTTQITIVFNQNEINAEIIKVKHEDKRGTHFCTIVFKYSENNREHTGKLVYSRLLIDRIEDLINPTYYEGKSITVLTNKKGDFQLKAKIKSEIILNSFYLIIDLFILFLFVEFSFFEKIKRKKSFFYVQYNNYKIKKIKEAKNISEYTDKLKKNEILCFGIEDNGKIIEYSYYNNRFIERTADKNKETEIIINDEEVVKEHIEKRVGSHIHLRKASKNCSF